MRCAVVASLVLHNMSIVWAQATVKYTSLKTEWSRRVHVVDRNNWVYNIVFVHKIILPSCILLETVLP